MLDSRLGPGTLTLGTPGSDYGGQISNVALEPSQNVEDGTPTLGEPDPLPLVTEKWVLKGEAIQDFGDAAGFLNYCFDNALTEVEFVFEPDSATAGSSVFTGTCMLVSIPIGGAVSEQVTSAFEFPVSGTPVRTNPATLSAEPAALEARAARRNRSTRTQAEQAAPAASKAKAKA